MAGLIIHLFLSKLAIASLKLGLDTPKRSANSLSEGSRSPGLKIPRNINFSIWSVTDEDSFSVIIFWKGIKGPINLLIVYYDKSLFMKIE